MMTAYTLPPTALDGQSRDAQTQLLLDMAKVEGATLSLVGAQPEDSPVFVLDNGVDLAVGTQWDCLRACMSHSGLEVQEPETVTDLSELLDVMGVWVVRLTTCGMDAGVLAQGETRQEARDKALQALTELTGASVLALQEWAQRQSAFVDLMGEVASKKPRAKRVSPYVMRQQVKLMPLPITERVRSQMGLQEPERVLRKQIDQMLAAPSGLHTAAGTEMSMTLQAIDDGETCCANYHDLLSAVRLGLDITALSPWPNDAAHRYLLSRQLKVTMRQRGYLELLDFDPAQVWSLDRPQVEETRGGNRAQEAHEPQPADEIICRRMTIEEVRALKPEWPPQPQQRCRVVMLLDSARLAMEQEPEWELSNCVEREVMAFAGRLWVEQHEPAAAPKKPRARRKQVEAGETV